MESRIDLGKAAEAEIHGALAIKRGQKPKVAGKPGQFTAAQDRALFNLTRSLVKIARDAGAEQRRVTIGRVSLELRENGVEEVLSIHTNSRS